MDIFKFNHSGSPTLLQNGEIINGLTKKTWIERYQKGGSFELVGDAYSNLREKLPVGTLISHVDSETVMAVENHAIKVERGTKAELVITGRGFETSLEERLVGMDVAFPNSDAPANYTAAAGYSWDQVVSVILDHVVNTVDANNAVPYISVDAVVAGTADNIAREVKRGDVYSAVLELLAIDDVGLRVIRPGPWSPLWGTANDENILFRVHKGTDRTNEVIFSTAFGEIENADYLWSIKTLKNAAWITSKWVQAFVALGPTGYSRRIMQIDGTKIDEHFQSEPTQGEKDAIRTQLEQLGLDTLASQTELSLSSAELSRDVIKAVYRQDYNIGDTITVLGDFNLSTKRRVDEFVEIEDENGSKGYPTLVTIEDD